MEHLEYKETELCKMFIPNGRVILCKRDDRFVGGYGGSKARMLKYILSPLKKQRVEKIITAGGPCSNFNRALAVYCAEMGIGLRIISYTDNKEEYEESLNYQITKILGAEYTFCKKTEVPDVVECEKRKLTAEKVNYKFIYGGAEGNIAGICAYYDAVLELKKQRDDVKHIFLPCGTGTTTTGICLGVQDFFPGAKVHAVSIARTWADEKKVLERNVSLMETEKGKKYSLDNLEYHDEFLAGGYSSTTDAINGTINEVARTTGMIMDPIYSGKAFWGMMNVIESIKESDKVLFWMTGGLINQLSRINSTK